MRISHAAAALAAFLTCVPHAPAAAQNAAGEWQGVILTPAGAVPFSVVLRSADDGWGGTFSIPAEGVRDMAIPAVEMRGDSAILTLRPPALLLRLAVEPDSLHGVLSTDGPTLPARLVRAGTPMARQMLDAAAAAAARARDRPLERRSSGAAAERVAAPALERLLAAAQAANSDAIVVLHDGELVGAWYAGGEPRPIEAMSATKSILSLAVGRLLTTGAIRSLDVPVREFFPEWSTGRKAQVTLRHLLNHTSGLHADRTTEAIYASDDFVRHALDSEVTAEPGTTFFYNNSATNLIAGIVGRAAGRPLDEFLRDDLFARLGITEFRWTRDAAGNPHGMAGLQILPEDMARIGQLMLDRGRFRGEQLIAAEYIDESILPAPPVNTATGLLWWLIRERPADGSAPAADARVIGYRAEGYLGQYLVVYPAERLVAVRMVRGGPTYDPATDGFREFAQLVRALVR